jgi:hypothetical protein
VRTSDELLMALDGMFLDGHVPGRHVPGRHVPGRHVPAGTACPCHPHNSICTQTMLGAGTRPRDELEGRPDVTGLFRDEAAVIRFLRDHAWMYNIGHVDTDYTGWTMAALEGAANHALYMQMAAAAVVGSGIPSTPDWHVGPPPPASRPRRRDSLRAQR